MSIFGKMGLPVSAHRQNSPHPGQGRTDPPDHRRHRPTMVLIRFILLTAAIAEAGCQAMAEGVSTTAANGKGASFAHGSLGKGEPCKLAGGTLVPDGWRGKDSSCDFCGQCLCAGGELGCSEAPRGWQDKNSGGGNPSTSASTAGGWSIGLSIFLIISLPFLNLLNE